MFPWLLCLLLTLVGSLSLEELPTLSKVKDNSLDSGWSLRLTDLLVPHHVVRGQSARLECRYHLGQENLYSVKWYMNGHEFFRFVPGEEPQVKVFPLVGVDVDLFSSNGSQVVLTSVSLETSGRYRCEVSGEAPSFQTVSESSDMLVVDLPSEGPSIIGGKPRYHVGEHVRVNCTSAKSIPAASLMWFINGEPAEEHVLRRFPLRMDSGGLETSTLGLEFRVRPKHFRDGDLKMKCLATIATIYWKSNEESVEGDRPQRAPVLESRETVPPGKRAAASSSDCSAPSVPSILWLLLSVVALLLHNRAQLLLYNQQR